MPDITMEEYINLYRNKLGCKTLASVTTAELTVNRSITPTTGIDINRKDINITSAGVSSITVPRIKVLNHNSAPVTNISNINVISDTPKVYPDKFSFNFSDYSTLKGVKTLIVPFNYGTTRLNTELVAVPQKISTEGVTVINITVLSGKYCEIKLMTSDGFYISTIDNLPGSLLFDKDTNSIKGIPFVVGDTTSTITLLNGVKVSLLFNIIPSSIVSEI